MAQTIIDIQAAHVSAYAEFECADIKITQKFSPTWNTEQSYGKMDGIPFYSHTSRTVQFEMTLLQPVVMNMETLNSSVDTFIKMQYPRYASIANSSQRTFAGAPFFLVNYLLRTNNGTFKRFPELQGYIQSLNVVPGHTKGHKPFKSGDRLLESQFEITFELVVMHDVLPGWGDTGAFESQNGFYLFGENATGGGGQGDSQSSQNSAAAAANGARYSNPTYNPNDSISQARLYTEAPLEMTPIGLTPIDGDT